MKVMRYVYVLLVLVGASCIIWGLLLSTSDEAFSRISTGDIPRSPLAYDGRGVDVELWFHDAYENNLLYFQEDSLGDLAESCVVMTYSKNFVPPYNYNERFDGRLVRVRGIFHSNRGVVQTKVGIGAISVTEIWLAERGRSSEINQENARSKKSSEDSHEPK